MKITTWKELWSEQRLRAAEVARSLAEEALTQASLTLKRITKEPAASCVAIQAEINEEGRRLFEDENSSEQIHLIQSKREQLEQALSCAEMEHEDTLPARLAALEEEIASRTDALCEAQDELDNVKMRREMAYRFNAPSPIHSYGTLSEAVRAICPVQIEKNQLGETYAQVEGVRIRITGDTSLTSVPPSSLRWAVNSNPSNAVVPPSLIRTPRRVVYIEQSGEILVGENADVQVSLKSGESHFYADVFGSLEAALSPYVEELRALQSINISDGKPLPLLGEVIRDACWKITADSVSYPKFPPGQSSLPEAQIHKLVGAYWKAFLDAPWEASIGGSYALLKHRCTRGETPNVFSYSTHGHFGFRVRTPDHDWITGEIYCPPEHFAPAKAPDQMEVINHPEGQDWLAELGPVKFLIRGKTSRS